MGRITQVTTKQNAAAASVTLASAIAYQPLSRLVQAMAYGNGLSDFNTHTLDYELDVLGVYNGATSVINRAHTRADRLNLTNIFDNVAAANNQVCAYGPANRLQNADGPWGKRTFYYDGVGNRTTEIATPPASTVATTDTLGYAPTNNRVSQIVRGGSTVRSFTYDGAGNLLTDNGLGGNKTYTYNRRNRLSGATVGALTYGYTYNAMEQLAIRQATNATPVTTTHFIHNIFGNVIAETAGGGATGATGTVREYIWLPETEIAPTMASRTQVDRPLAVVDAVNGASPATWWVSVDHLNRPVRMTTSTKAAVWDAVWLPWGGVHAITGSASLDARFPGQWFQLETGLHYNWHRSYDPTVGRYTQPDPLGFVDGPSVYGYARAAPWRFVDRNGRTTYAVVNTNGYTGHVGVVVVGPSGNALYDPGGSYREDTIGSGQALFGDDVNLSDYVNYQRQDGPDVEVIAFATTAAQEKKIIDNIEGRGGCLPGYCAKCSSSVFNNTAPFFKDLPGYFFPSSFGSLLKRRGGSPVSIP